MPDTINAAGILLRIDNTFLLIKRADNGAWEAPGGHIQSGESQKEAAIRECIEEIGSCPSGENLLLSHSVKIGGEGTYTTFIQDCAPFEVKLNPESTESGWFEFETLPIDTIPCLVDIIRALSGTEIDIAKGIQSNLLTSPQRYENIWLFDVRITGTGTSYRTALEEYVYRPPENFLTDDFLQRCNGLPLIFQHPKKSIILNTDEFRERSIGNVFLPYIKNDEVWGIAKVHDEDAASAMQTSHTSTSPAVVFRKAGSTETIELEDGKSVLIEGVPSYLDHLAVCQQGVWDKGGEPAGITLTGDEIMAGEDKAPAWADALCAKVDSVIGRVDSMEMADKARKDAEDEAKKKADYDATKTEDELKADKARKDAEEDEAKKVEAKKAEEEKADAARKLSESQAATIADMQARLSVLSQPLSAADRDQLSAAQSRADSVAQMYGDSVAAPLHGESPIAYRKRLASKFQKHSKEFADIKLDALDGPVFDQVESKIYSDAQAHAMSPSVAVAGRLIPHVRLDSVGRTITTYTGDMNAWLNIFKSKPWYITGINTNPRQGAN